MPCLTRAQLHNPSASLGAGPRVIHPMNLQFVTHEGYAERFEQYASKAEPEGDHGTLLTLVNVQNFDRKADGRWEFAFNDGHTVEVPYGELRRGYDHGV